MRRVGGTILVIEGFVTVYRVVDGIVVEKARYKSKGTSIRGNTREAVKKMRLHARYQFGSDHPAVRTGEFRKTRIDTWDITQQGIEGLSAQEVIVRGVKRLITRDTKGRIVANEKVYDLPKNISASVVTVKGKQSIRYRDTTTGRFTSPEPYRVDLLENTSRDVLDTDFQDE